MPKSERIIHVGKSGISGVGEGDGSGDGEGVGEVVGEGAGVSVGVGVGAGLGEGVGDGVGVGVCAGSNVAEIVCPSAMMLEKVYGGVAGLPSIKTLTIR